MDKRAPLRQYYQAQEDKALSTKQFTERTAQLNDLENTVVRSIGALVKFMDGKTTKTEVVNQLKSISTPDVDKVVSALSKLDANILANKLDLKPLEQALNGVKREVSLIPKTLPKFDQKESVKVTNLSDVKLDTSDVVKAIKALKLDPTIDVKAPVVNVDKPDLKPLQDVMLDLLKAVEKIELPAFPEIPVTDLTKVEKKLDESNKHLKAISEKKMGGGGGGGGNGTPYINDEGKAVNVALVGGAIPITGSITASSSTLADFSVNDIEEDTTSYFGSTKPDGTWLVKSLTATSVAYATVSNNGTVTSYTDAWTDRAILTFGRFDEAF